MATRCCAGWQAATFPRGRKTALDLDGFYALHPRLQPLMPLWQKGSLAFARWCRPLSPRQAQPFRRSGRLRLETGNDLPVDRRIGGWLNRLLQVVPRRKGRDRLFRRRRADEDPVGRGRASQRRPRAARASAPQAQMLLEHVYHDDPLFRDAARDAVEIGADAPRMDRIAGPTADATAFAASRLNGRKAASPPDRGAGTPCHARAASGAGAGPAGRGDPALRATGWPELGSDHGAGDDRIRGQQNGSRDRSPAPAALLMAGRDPGGRAYGDWPGWAKVSFMPIAT